MSRRSFLLLGSGEFEPWSAEPERDALADASGDGSALILPIASAPEGDHVFDRWASMGLEHYASTGVLARVVPVKVRGDAERTDLTGQVRTASLVFFSGGSPRYLADTLDGTALWTAVLGVLDRGAVYAGCSAGAMVASRRPPQRQSIGSRWMAGLDLVPHVRFGAHWNRMRYLPGFRGATSATADGWFVGIDERTAILGDGERWRVYGAGAVEVRGDGAKRSFRAGETFATPG
jgi:cyanophycinase